jgi:hypothetical protein
MTIVGCRPDIPCTARPGVVVRFGLCCALVYYLCTQRHPIVVVINGKTCIRLSAVLQKSPVARLVPSFGTCGPLCNFQATYNVLFHFTSVDGISVLDPDQMCPLVEKYPC